MSLVALCGSVAAALSAEQPKPAAGKPPASTAAKQATSSGVQQRAQTAQPAISMQEFMAHVVSYTAYNMWSKQGWVTDSSGEHSQFPKNDEEWEEAEGAALTLSELMGILLQPERRIDVPGWDTGAQQVRKLALQAAAAAEKHDEAAFFKYGTDIQEACELCHVAVGLNVR